MVSAKEIGQECTGVPGFTRLCVEHLVCCSEASVRRVWERGSLGVFCSEKFVEGRFDDVLPGENVDIGSKLRCALLPFHHREELGELGSPNAPVPSLQAGFRCSGSRGS